MFRVDVSHRRSTLNFTNKISVSKFTLVVLSSGGFKSLQVTVKVHPSDKKKILWDLQDEW